MMKSILHISIVVVCSISLLLFTACGHIAGATTTVTMQDSLIPYDLASPSEQFELSNKLREISGIVCYKKRYIVGVQDEKGSLFLMKPNTGDIVEKINFSADGDYEDLALVGEVLYAIRSDGVLFRITNWKNKNKVETKVLDTNLGELNDTEGLTYHAQTNSLWIACKASAVIGEREHEERAIYQYQLDSNHFDTTPIFTVGRKQLKEYLKTIKGTERYDAIKKETKKAKKEMAIRPSAIEIHPTNQDVYILSAVSNLLLVLDSNYQIKSCIPLSSKQFEQPEGLAFDGQSNLYISSEGRKEKAMIYKFDYMK